MAEIDVLKSSKPFVIIVILMSSFCRSFKNFEESENFEGFKDFLRTF